MSLPDDGRFFHNCNHRVIVLTGADSYGLYRTLHAAPASVINLRGRSESYMRRSLLATTFGLLAIAASASAATQSSKPATPAPTTSTATATEKADNTKHHAKKEKAHKEKHKTGTTTDSTEKKPAAKP